MAGIVSREADCNAYPPNMYTASSAALFAVDFTLNLSVWGKIERRREAREAMENLRKVKVAGSSD